MITIDRARFFASLQSTQAYCEQQLQHKEKPDWIILRSTISPVYENGKWFAHTPGCNVVDSDEQPISWEEWTEKSDPYLDSFVALFNRQLEFKTKVSKEGRHNVIYQGKILVVEYGENIPDSAAEAETDGFFDEKDLPPIDTWFYNDYSPPKGGILFAWIPEKFIKLADRAIEVQFLDILYWFEKPSDWKV